MALLIDAPILAATARPFTGLLCTVPTPFADDESLDLASLDRAVRLAATAGVDAVTVLGEFGEAERLTESEMLAVVRAAGDAAGPLPVIVDAVQPGTVALIAFARQIFDLGAAAIGLTVPVEFDEPRLRHRLERLANAVALPIVLVEAPGLHRNPRSIDVVAGLARDLPSVVSIQTDTSASVRRVAAFREKFRGPGRAITVLGRLEPVVSPFEEALTPDGIVVGLAFPEIARALLDALRAADRRDLATAGTSCTATLLLGQETHSALIKEVLRQRRLFTSSQVRDPGIPADEATSRYVRSLVNAALSDANLGRVVDPTPRPFLVNI